MCGSWYYLPVHVVHRLRLAQDLLSQASHHQALRGFSLIKTEARVWRQEVIKVLRRSPSQSKSVSRLILCFLTASQKPFSMVSSFLKNHAG